MPEAVYVSYTEQDTADKLILPYLTSQFGYPPASSLDFQAQHQTPLQSGGIGRYDGLYLHGGYPYVILEAKRFAHDLTPEDIRQARSYATSGWFDAPVPFLIVSNGRTHRFFKRSEVIDPSDGLPTYGEIPATQWSAVRLEPPGQVRQLLHEADLVASLLDFKKRTYKDISALFYDSETELLDPTRSRLGTYLKRIIESRHIFIGDSNIKSQAAVRHAIEAISLHFTTKILFIKLIEDLSPSAETPRVIHDLFPRADYDLIGGLFGYKVLNALSPADEVTALKLFARSKRFYKAMAQNIASVTWSDIFRYGFRVHSGQYGKLFRSTNYDRFLPSEGTLELIHKRLIGIDIRFAVLYGDPEARSSVIGRIYEQLIDEELRNSIGAVYTPDTIIEFMLALGRDSAGRFRHRKFLEPSCGSGHFYKRLYRLYVDEVLQARTGEASEQDVQAAHSEALRHIYGRDIDPFAVQLTLLGTFLEQLKDNVVPATGLATEHAQQWAANSSIDTQNSLDPITIHPDIYFDVKSTRDLTEAKSLVESCKRALGPDLIIGNPPYGVRVVKGDHYDDVYSLTSPDSYGYFIANALERLQENGRVIFIVSSTFLSIKTHQQLRRLILDRAKILKVVKLNRLTFPAIDVFPVIVELQRCSSAEQRQENFYQMFDLGQLSPAEDADDLRRCLELVKTSTQESPWPLPRTRTAKYVTKQRIIESFSRLPIFEGRPSLFSFMQDVFPTTPPVQRQYQGADGTPHTISVCELRGRDVAKLGAIADVAIGLQTGDNRTFYRTAPGVSGGAVKGGYLPVQPENVLAFSEIANLTQAERLHGVEVNDLAGDHYYVPLDKAGAFEIEAGILPSFWRPVEYYVNWSSQAVAQMRSHPSSAFRNADLYFHEGISFSTTGIYSPSFRIGHGGVFDQKSSCIFSDVIATRPLLGLLCSTLMRYFAKAFINQGVDAQVPDLPIVLPNGSELESLETSVNSIIEGLQIDQGYDYRPKLQELDDIVYDIYGLTWDEREEVRTWYVRHYQKLQG